MGSGPSIRGAKEAFLRASALEGAERDAFLDALRREDAAIHARVRDLLHHDAGPAGSLGPAADLVAAALADAGVPGRPEVADYELLRELGAGGMGRVFLARHRALHTLRALKVLRVRSPRLSQRLRREGQLQQSLRHPHVLRVVDVTETTDREPALVMELVDGPTLADVLAAGVTLTVSEIEALGRGILEGVSAAHDAGWVHRDLKPANVLLEIGDATLVPKVADFGLAKVIEGDQASPAGHTTQRGGLGTRRYMSLEQLTGQPPHRRMDVFALGAVLFELCEGTPAFPTDRHWEQALADGQRPGLTRPDLPARFRAVVEAALAPPAQRPEHARDLLERWTGGPELGEPFQPETLRLAALLRDHLPPSGGAETGGLDAHQLEHLSVCARCRDARPGVGPGGGTGTGAEALVDEATGNRRVLRSTITGGRAGPAEPLATSEPAAALAGAVEHLRRAWHDRPADATAPDTGVALHLVDAGSDPQIAHRVLNHLAGACRRGQLLASRRFVDALEDRRGLAVTSHGTWQSLAHEAPIEIVELGEPAWAPMQPPAESATAWRVGLRGGAWRPLRTIPQRLPAEPDRFVGREDALRELGARVQEQRLVTVHGAPGMGKTRTALRMAHAWLGAWPGGVWFCAAAGAHDSVQLCQVVAETLEVPLGARDPVDTLGAAIQSRGRCLVVLDNLEQLGTEAASVVQRWLDQTTEAAFLVTSRTPLGLSREAVVRLEPLSEAQAAALFHQRAAQVQASFDASAHAPDVQALVKLLDGLPLAIELCAARVRVLTPADMLARMQERFRLLAGAPGRPDRPDRQATLRACLAWSWAQLRPWEQVALAQLSVFAAGFGPEAAEAVLELGPDAPDPLLVIEALLDHALLRSASGRLSLLLSIQAFAAEHLTAPARESAEARHATYYSRFGEPAWLQGLGGPEQTSRRQALAQEADNVVLACDRALASPMADVAARTAVAAWRCLEDRGPLESAAVRLEAAALGPGEAAIWALAHAAHARLLQGRADAAGPHLLAALDRSRDLDHPVLQGFVRQLLGVAAMDAGHLDDARGHFEAARARFERADAVARQAGIDRYLGVLRWRAGDLAAAREFLETALAGQRQAGNRHGEAMVLSVLAIVDNNEGHYDASKRRNLQAAAIFRDLGSRIEEARVLGNLANTYQAQGNYDEARALMEATLAHARRVGSRSSEASLLNNLGNLHRIVGDFDRSQACYEASLALHEQVVDRRAEGEALCNLAHLRGLQGHVDEARRLFERAIAVTRQAGHRVFEGIALGNLGALCVDEHALDDAERWLNDALAVHRDIGRVRSEAFVTAKLGDVAWRRGAHAEAIGRYEHAAVLAREAGYSEVQVFTAGRLAVAAATAGRHEEATAHLDDGERPLGEEGVGARTRLEFLCDRAVVQALAARPEPAGRSLEEARRAFAQLALPADSSLACRLLATAWQVLDAASGPPVG